MLKIVKKNNGCYRLVCGMIETEIIPVEVNKPKEVKGLRCGLRRG